MNISAREKSIWIEFTITGAVSIYFFFSSYMLSGWAQIASYEMGIVVRNVIILSIIASIILYGLFGRETPEDKDERDLAIESRGNACGYFALTILCGLLVAFIMLSEGRVLLGRATVINGPVAMHLILIALMISALFKQASQLLNYRRS
jgi:hypothetical protein